MARQARAQKPQGKTSGPDFQAPPWPVSTTTCRHCANPVPANRSDCFCCAGCAAVHHLLEREELAHFYELRGDQVMAPVSPHLLQPRDDGWLRNLAANLPEGTTLRLAIQGISCLGCVWLLERVFARSQGARRIVIDSIRAELEIQADFNRFDLTAFAREIQAFGYLLGPAQENGAQESSRSMEQLQQRMGLCGAFAMNAMAFSLPAYFGMPANFAFAGWFDLIAATSASASLMVGGSYFAARAWQSLRAGVLHIDTPIALGIIAAYAGSMIGWLADEPGLKYFDFVATFIFLMLAGRWVQQAAVQRHQRRLMRDSSVATSVAVEGFQEPVALGDLQIGQRIEIPQGQAIPTAARLLDPEASISMEWISGESAPIRKTLGQLLNSGALNIGSRPLRAEILESWPNSTLHQLLKARRQVHWRDEGLEHLLAVYLKTVILIAVLGLGWWWMKDRHGLTALQVAISVLVVSCPCALGVALPLAEELACRQAERIGVFVRQLGLWKKLLRLRCVAFDKTGTLTTENPRLRQPELLQGLSDNAKQVLRTMITGNLHPISRSLFDELGPGATRSDCSLQERVGEGIWLTEPNGLQWVLQRGVDGQGTQLLCGGQNLTTLHFDETLRPQAQSELQTLQKLGLGVFVLSGDQPQRVAQMAERLGLGSSQAMGAMSPAQKAAWLRANTNHDALFLGDGANDSLAFDAALCAGSPVSGRSFLEQKADFYFLGSHLGFVSELLRVAQRHRRATRLVFAFSVSYNAVTVAAGLAGMLSPLAAAVLMPLSSLITLGLVRLSFAQPRAGRRESPALQLAAKPA